MNPKPFDHFSQVIEKISKNKLSKNNAFEHRIVDSISQFIQDENSEKIDWIKFSAGVDGCGIIYAYCVDSLHSDVLQILSGLNLNRSKEKNSEEKVLKSKTKVINGCSTLEKPENISNQKIENYEKTDFLFKSYSQKLDSGNFKGLLMNNFSINSCLDYEIHEDELAQNEIRTGSEFLSFEARKVRKNEDFLIDIQRFWKGKKVESVYFEDPQPDLLETQTEFLEFKEKQDTTDLNQKHSDFAHSHEFPRDPVDSLSEGQDSDEELSENELIDDPTFDIEQKLVDLDKINKLTLSINNNWAGSDYWKSLKKLPILKRKNIENPLTLTPTSSLSKAELFKRCRQGYSNSFSSTSISNMKENLPSLPESFQYTSKSLTSLYNLSKAEPPKNPENFCLNSVDEPAELSSTSDPIIDSFKTNPSTKTANSGVLVSKTVNIKKLKKILWNSLSVRTKESLSGNEEMDSFLNIIQELPNLVDEVELNNLSVHTCFIALLHLANEKNLLLKPKNACDFFIKY